LFHATESGQVIFRFLSPAFPDKALTLFCTASSILISEHVGWAFGEDTVALRVDVGAEAEEDFAGVVQVW